MAFWQSKHHVINTGFFFRARVRSCGLSQSVTGLYKQQFQFHRTRCQPFHSKQSSEPYPLILWVVHPTQREALRSPPTLQTGSTGALRNSRVRSASRTRATWKTSTQFFPLRDLHLWARWNIHWKAENRYRWLTLEVLRIRAETTKLAGFGGRTNGGHMFEPVCAVFIPVTVFIVAVRVAPLLQSGLAHTRKITSTREGWRLTGWWTNREPLLRRRVCVCVSVCVICV